MYEAYMKTLIKDGGGKWHVIRIAAETEEGLNLKRDIYLAKAWGDSSKEEYDAQLEEVRTRAEEAAAQDADESQEDVEKEELPEEGDGEEAADSEVPSEDTEESPESE